MKKKRLLKLADLLDEDAKNPKGIKFNLNTWGSTHDNKKPISCNTEACAMGLAVVSGKFKRAGLTRYIDPHGPFAIHFRWQGENVTGMTAAMRLFDINVYAADYLFAMQPTPNHGIGAKAERAVAKSIREFVAGKLATHLYF